MKPNPLPPAIVILDHANPVDFSREVAPILGDLVVSHLRKLAAECPRSDSELVAMATSHPSANVQDLASALFHERTGQHTNGVCDLCELPHVESLAERALARRVAVPA